MNNQDECKPPIREMKHVVLNNEINRLNRLIISLKELMEKIVEGNIVCKEKQKTNPIETESISLLKVLEEGPKKISSFIEEMESLLNELEQIIF